MTQLTKNKRLDDEIVLRYLRSSFSGSFDNHAIRAGFLEHFLGQVHVRWDVAGQKALAHRALGKGNITCDTHAADGVSAVVVHEVSPRVTPRENGEEINYTCQEKLRTAYCTVCTPMKEEIQVALFPHLASIANSATDSLTINTNPFSVHRWAELSFV